MGGVSRPDPWGIGQGVGAVGAVGSPAEVPQAPPRPEEAQAQATERGEGQACRHREDSKSPSYVYKLTHPRGCGLILKNLGHVSIAGGIVLRYFPLRPRPSPRGRAGPSRRPMTRPLP